MIRYFDYLSYVFRHKYHVARAGLSLGVSWWRLLKHDWTKFLPCELVPYVRYFNPRPGDNRDAVVKAFDVAWNHHQKANDHHWQHWLLTRDTGETVPLPMPRRVVAEMVADWIGAGAALGLPNTQAWYEKNRPKMALHAETEIWVLHYLAIARVRGLIP